MVDKRDIPQNLLDSLPEHIVANNNYQQDWITDTTQFRKEFNFKESIPLKEAIKRTVKWNRKNHPKELHKEFNPSKVDYEYEDRIFQT
ncbi:hypothetical protein ACFSKI_19605 [Pseudogracilibacillus auburnensis]|uniref:Uncharacterized protein n=1 Tax=Pseudogracilibacillus auburnensis TaxID=1494959 RepID=A0A2V3VVV7_9BACI|nr:hypothetical protein [Pseudogracilibacillus auburnensis]PXW85124.1 hypothetical protein DFR56_112102 [Pseudogracilibacillus auburnensis]